MKLSASYIAQMAEADWDQDPPNHQRKPQQRRVDQSIKLFNTAIIATKVPRLKNYSARLSQLVNTGAFRSIIMAIQAHAEESGKTEEEAAEELIRTFREIDQIWDDYITQEGLEKLKSHLSG